MKKILLAVFLIAFSTIVVAQNSFDSKIKENTVKLDKATTLAEYDNLFSSFSQLLQTPEVTNKWKAYYFASLTQFKKAELLIKSNNMGSSAEANAMAYKYINGIAHIDKQEVKKLLELINTQKKLISSTSSTK